MRQAQTFGGFLMGGALVLLAAQPSLAASTLVTAVELNKSENELKLILETKGNGDEPPQIVTTSRGNDLVADIVDTSLQLNQGDNFLQENPMPGITEVSVTQLDQDKVRVTVSGTNSPPTGQILQQDDGEISLSFSTTAPVEQAASPNAEDSGLTQPTLPTPAPNSSPTNQTSLTPTTVAQVPSLPATPTAQTLPTPAPTSPPANQIPPTSIPQTIPPPTTSPQTPPGVAAPVPPPTVQPPNPDVLVPNPEITINGVPAQPAGPAGVVQPVAPAPPFLPRAIAPPVGDIAISNVNAAASVIDLGTAVRVPRLVLREAPVREVLALLARAAGLNLAFTGDEGGGTPGAPPGAAGGAQQTISLDLENEAVQDVFNYVLQISGLQANRVGRTIFVGPQLPVGARNIFARTLRLNQVDSAQAAGFLIAQGAEQQQITTQTTLTVVGEGAAAQRIENTSTTVQRITPQVEGQGQGAQATGAPLLLRGLAVSPDDRLNSITLIGEPRQIEIATALLTQLDLRRRQVAVNVKIVDVNLTGTDAFNASFSFGIGDSFFTIDQGAAAFNYGGFNPPTTTTVTGSVVSPPVIGNPFAGATVFLDPNNPISVPGTVPGTVTIDPDGNITRTDRGAGTFPRPLINLDDPLQGGIITITPATDNVITRTRQPDGTIQTTVTQGTVGDVTVGLPSLFQYPSRLLAALQAQITSGNAKILTDPTLVVQEGETATVNLTQEVIGNIESETEANEGIVTRSVTAEIREAGLILEIAVDRIDDNGFITLAVNPRVASIGAVQNLSLGDDTNQIALLNVRQLASGQIRLRDGQTLILSGIIQESDRTTVRKVPILGDIPILGALFRSTERTNQRQEVIVLLTPQIIDDSALYPYGYNYTPTRDARQLIQQR